MVLKRNRRSGFVAIEGKVYRVPVHVVERLEEWVASRSRDKVDETMRIVQANARKGGACKLVAELDLVLNY